MTTLNRWDAEPPSDAAGPHAGRPLLDAMERVLRHGERGAQGVTAVAVHLSRVAPGGPRPHHRRVASAVLEDLAGREAGQLFGLPNGDMVLLFRPADRGAGTAATIARLFGGGLAEPASVCSVWPLPEQALAALSYVRDCLLEGDRATPAPEGQGSAAAVAAMQATVRTAPLPELTRRQTAILLRPAGQPAVVPLFREVVISLAALGPDGAAAKLAAADPFLFNHLLARLDKRMLTALRDDIPAGGPLSEGLGGAGLHLNLTLPGVLSQGFAALVEAAAPAMARGLQLGVELPFAEVFADAQAFVLARERLRLAGCDLVLDGVTHQALMLTSLAALQPSLVKLSWSPALASSGAAVAAALRRLPPERVVLHRTDSEAAVAWGLRQGISRFQGHTVDAMLAAERVKRCPASGGCTVRLCADRAAGAGTGGTGCANPALLAAALPAPAPLQAA